VKGVKSEILHQVIWQPQFKTQAMLIDLHCLHTRRKNCFRFTTNTPRVPRVNASSVETEIHDYLTTLEYPSREWCTSVLENSPRNRPHQGKACNEISQHLIIICSHWLLAETFKYWKENILLQIAGRQSLCNYVCTWK